MPFNPSRVPLCVIQATITEPDGRSTMVAHSMPAAPFGTLAWQLPLLSGYIARLHRDRIAPTTDTFTAYMTARASARIPSPTTPYPYTPWHDGRITCLLDVALTPRGFANWPGVSLVIVEQDSVGPAACSWTRMERERGVVAVLGRALKESAAEQARLADQMRGGGEDGVRELHALAEQVTEWTGQQLKAARAERTLANAAKVRTVLRTAT
ncbi:hypothetical protein [Streptomyces sp. NBC_01500]|uniref:hypothetical protein n=1 Tax=Streptomyces sp. NBC_01500 TaxID=2903886 RepID=UPI0022586C7E|nr:hypothetical protein [Streptomyces sp. NBC_01500]MCX4554219.1 hypothetical protein [Streptomyces sp. NBC_01500]